MVHRRLALGLLLAAARLAAQDAAPFVQVTGAVKQHLQLTRGDLAQMPCASVKTTGNGVQTVYEAVWLHEVLKRAGAPQGETLRGKAMAGYVLAEASGARSVRLLARLEVARLRK
jgi:hypothetical protein